MQDHLKKEIEEIGVVKTVFMLVGAISVGYGIGSAIQYFLM